MAIEKLANGAIATLGAHQTLTDPASLVKELIDNALDANATSIAIEISTNVLDVIQVRDNGHGIAPDDRPLVARPNCTSKLHDFDDLKSVGGSTLGFRGQALASAAEMSGTLTISTRVEGEEISTALKIDQHGEITSQERASLPVGTMVRITDFIKANPVRRQRILKEAEKYLKQIKQTLYAYAFARPHARLSLRVLKAKNDKLNYVYAPKPGGNVEDAALKIVGSACVSQCTWTVIEDRGFSLQAFVPRPDGDPSKLSGIGAFLSVDGRPVSAARGTFKQLVKIYREALKKSNARFEGIKEPFLHMSIACPSTSYDANVEPAKDDVLFEDADTVVELTRRLFATVYPPAETPVPTEDRHKRAESVAMPIQKLVHEDEDDFITSLESQRGPKARSAVDAGGLLTPFVTSEPANATEAEPPTRRAFRSNMYGCDEEDIELMDARPPTGRTEADFEELRQARKDVNVSNPWVMAKMNTTLRRSLTEEQDAPVEEPSPDVQLPDQAITRGQPKAKDHGNEHIYVQGLPTPRPSSPSPPAGDFHPSDHVPDIRLARDGRLIGSQALPSPRLHQQRPLEASSSVADWIQGQPAVRDQPAYNIMLSDASEQPGVGTPLHAIPNAGQRPRRNQPRQQAPTPVNRPFVSPVVDGPPRERVWFDHLESEGRSHPKQRRQYQQRFGDGELVHQGELGDLLDDPRPLTPPRRNRDIRDFVDSVDLSRAESAASFIEGRNYAQARRTRSVSRPRSVEGDENASPTKGVLKARGFMPASELAALEARSGLTLASPEKVVARTPKRRKTSEGRALRELGTNSPVTAQQDDAEMQEAPESRPASRRRRTADNTGRKPTRTKSSRLPLERTPKGQGVHDLELSLAISEAEVSRWAGKIDEDASLLGWNQPSLDAYNAFASTPDGAGIERMASKLHELLINRVSDGEIVQDLGELVQRAFGAQCVEDEDTDNVVSQ